MAGRSRPIAMDSTVMQYIPCHYMMDGLTDSFGLEIELEGTYITTEEPAVMNYWKGVKDGSLRIKPGVVGAQALEYVFRGPQNLNNTAEALKVLFGYLKSNPMVKVFDSYRTSIHVHVNCMQETFRTVMNFITLSMIFDELFVSQNGQTRIGNNFCLRTRDAEGQLNDLINSVQTYGTPYNIGGANRYSSVNVSSLAKYGTIEFRSLECSTDFDRVWHWINTLQALKAAARTYKDPRDVISRFSQLGPDAFILSVLGAQAKKYVAVKGHQQMLHHGMRLAQDFAYCSEWRLPGKDDIKPKKVNQKLNKIIPGLHQPGWAFADGHPWNVPIPLAAGDWNAYIAAAGEIHAAQPMELQPAVAHPVHAEFDDLDIEFDPHPIHALDDEEEDDE